MLFTIQKEKIITPRGHRNHSEYQIILCAEQTESEWHSPVLKMSLDEFLAATYNIVALEGIPQLACNSRFFDFDDVKDFYKFMSSRLACQMEEQRNPEKKMQWFSSVSDKPYSFSAFMDAVSKNNASITEDISYRYSPEFTCVFHQNITELLYIANICILYFYFNDSDAPEWIREELPEGFNPEDKVLVYQLCKSFYTSYFHHEFRGIRAIPALQKNGQMMPVLQTDCLADVICLITVAQMQHQGRGCRICKNCGRAFVPKNGNQISFCSDKCRNELRRYESQSELGSIYNHIEGCIKNNIYNYCAHGSPGYAAGMETLEAWRKDACDIKDEYMENWLNCIYCHKTREETEQILSDYELCLIDIFARQAEVHGFTPARWPTTKHSDMFQSDEDTAVQKERISGIIMKKEEEKEAFTSFLAKLEENYDEETDPDGENRQNALDYMRFRKLNPEKIRDLQQASEEMQREEEYFTDDMVFIEKTHREEDEWTEMIRRQLFEISSINRGLIGLILAKTYSEKS